MTEPALQTIQSPLETLTILEMMRIAQEPYEHRGIIHSEMAYIIHMCRQFGVRCIIESGRARGQSTYMLAKYMPDVTIYSIDLRPDHPDNLVAYKRLNQFNNIELLAGDSRERMPNLARGSTGTTAVLLDGPKGKAAVDLLAQCFEYPQVKLGFIHDMRRLDHGKPSPHRQAMIDRFPNAIFTDDPGLVSSSSWMDATIMGHGGPSGPTHEAEFGSYGPTLGMAINGAVSRT